MLNLCYTAEWTAMFTCTYIDRALSQSRGITFRCKPLLRQQHVTRERTSLRRYFIANDISRLRAAVIALPFRHPASRRAPPSTAGFTTAPIRVTRFYTNRENCSSTKPRHNSHMWKADYSPCSLWIEDIISISSCGLREKRVNGMMYKGYVPDYPYFVSFTDFFLSFLKYS